MQTRFGDDSCHLFLRCPPCVSNCPQAASKLSDDARFREPPLHSPSNGQVRSPRTLGRILILLPKEAGNSAEGNANPPAPAERRPWSCCWVCNVSRSSGYPSWKNDCASAAPGSSRIFSMPTRPAVCPPARFEGQLRVESPFEVASPLPERFDND